MEPIRQPIRTFIDRRNDVVESDVKEVREHPGAPIDSYRTLVERVANIAFANPEFVLLFRGQTNDYKERHGSTLFPSMFRKQFDGGIDSYPLKERYEELRRAEYDLVEALRHTEYGKRISRSQLLRWAIIQHYEICPTPLLDLTHSLLVAASFAFANARDAEDHVYLFVLGVPQINGSITVTSDQNIQLIRLASVCPPTTLRPYFQEGYLLGTYPLLDTVDEKMHYPREEVDCAKRLVAKFRLKRVDFWRDGFSPMHDTALYPYETNEITEAITSLRGRQESNW